jgi:ribosomal-protein-serine acetyltransferase
MFTFKIDENVELRLLEERHAEELFALSDKNRAYLRQWLPWLDRTQSAADSKGFIQFTLSKFAKNEGYTAGIWYQGKLAGVIAFNEVNWANKKAIIGYWCGSEYQGLGLVTKACRAFINHAFKEWKLNRIEIACATGNTKSQAIPKRLGFTQEGVSRDAEWLYDHYVDHVNFAILARDWKVL